MAGTVASERQLTGITNLDDGFQAASPERRGVPVSNPTARESHGLRRGAGWEVRIDRRRRRQRAYPRCLPKWNSERSSAVAAAPAL